MMRMSQSIRVFLLLFITVALVVGCSSNNTNGNNNGATNVNQDLTVTENNTPEVSQLDPYEVVMLLPGDPQADHDLVIAEVNKILKSKINATLDLQFIDWG